MTTTTKKQFGDWISVGKEKPEGDKLTEIILVLTEQMMQCMDTLKADINGIPVTFVIKEPHATNDHEWTVGWKVTLDSAD